MTLRPIPPSRKISFNIPQKWRTGQFFFNFLEFLRSKGVPTNQNERLADSFHLSDEDWDKYLKEYLKTL